MLVLFEEGVSMDKFTGESSDERLCMKLLVWEGEEGEEAGSIL